MIYSLYKPLYKILLKPGTLLSKKEKDIKVHAVAGENGSNGGGPDT
jgi:hypothetical protein